MLHILLNDFLFLIDILAFDSTSFCKMIMTFQIIKISIKDICQGCVFMMCILIFDSVLIQITHILCMI